MTRLSVHLTLTFFLCLALAACGGQQDAERTIEQPDFVPEAPVSREADVDVPMPEGEAPAPDRYEVAVVPKGLVHEFWLTVKAGADAAGDEYGAEILWKGPEQETDVAKQINIMQDMISRDVDAIVMAACDAQGLVDVVEEAVAAGIPVVTIDSGVDSEAPVTHVATDNLAGAKAAAEELVRLIGGTGKVGLIPFVPGAATSELRERGFKDGLEGHPEVELVATLYSYSDVARGMSATEDMLTSNPDLDGIFAANESGAMGAVQALEAANKAGEVKLVAFDAAERQVEALRAGTIQALVVQNPFQMGYQGVKAAIDHLQGRDVPGRIDTGVTVVTPRNIDDPDVVEVLEPLHAE